MLERGPQLDRIEAEQRERMRAAVLHRGLRAVGERGRAIAGGLRQHAGERQCAVIDSALQRLAGDGAAPSGARMARLFKALAVTAPGLDVPPGFETALA